MVTKRIFNRCGIRLHSSNSRWIAGILAWPLSPLRSSRSTFRDRARFPNPGNGYNPEHGLHDPRYPARFCLRNSASYICFVFWKLQSNRPENDFSRLLIVCSFFDYRKRLVSISCVRFVFGIHCGKSGRLTKNLFGGECAEIIYCIPNRSAI